MEKRVLLPLLLLLLGVLTVVIPAVQSRTIDKSTEDVASGSSQQSTQSRRKNVYRWKSENWRSCFSSDSPNGCGQGIKERSVHCVDSDDKTVSKFHCDLSTEPEKIRPCFTACRHHKDKLKWEVGPWGPCLEAEKKLYLTFNNYHQTKNGDTKDNSGLMQRNVSCILTSHSEIKLRMVVDEENCFTVARKPDPVRFCSIPKPQDCVVTEFHSWSSCKGCQLHANQTRIRTVIVAPKNDGKPCPKLTETRACSHEMDCLTSVNEEKSEYRLKVGAWRRCEASSSLMSTDEMDFRQSQSGDRNSILPMLDSSSSAESAEKQTIFQPEVGHQSREILCKDAAGVVVDLSLCNKRPDSMPPRIRSCVVSQDCVVSDWSAWSKVQDGCIETSGVTRAVIHERKRQVIRLPGGDGQPCPHLIEKKETSNKEALPLCKQKYKRMPSKWSDCGMALGSKLTKVGCGGGIQLRTVSCVLTSSRQPVDDSHCTSTDDSQQLATVQRCEVACPRDCVVGEWGPWSPCIRTPCTKNSTTAVKGYRERKRPILVQPSAKGLPCPAVEEVQPCNEVHCFHWSVGHWEMCVLDTPAKCGPGIRSRSIKCLDSTRTEVDPIYCGYEEKPPDQEPCLLPCPFDCVLSPWSDWSPCSHPCSGPKMVALRQRNRTIIAPPGPGGHKCPNPDELLQMEPCNTHSCYGYSWLTLPWQPCKSDDSAWTPSYNIIEGRVPDFDYPKNETLYDDTEEEPGEEKNCGKGFQTREVWCVENNNNRVADVRCSPLEKPPTNQPCLKDCPEDCQLSPWSEWSSCPQECVPDASNEVRDGEKAPTQFRSRVILKSPTSGGAPCANLEELRPCPLSAARCKHYLWQLTNWTDCQVPGKCGEGYRTRGVWCSRNHRTSKVAPTFCIENAGLVPSLSEKCTKTCKHHCALTEWSAWSECSSSCRGNSVRTRKLIGNSPPLCLNNDLYPLKETRPCPCEFFTAMQQGEWSPCIIHTSVEKVLANGRSAQSICGIGTRYKKNVCTNAAGQIVEPSFCELQSNLLEEECLVPCPVDCVQSQWSTWGECSALCGPGFQNRTRQILNEPRENGRPCGPDIEVKVCNTPCSNFRWVSSGYTQCMLAHEDEAHGCGIGEQYRTVRCMDYSQSGVPIQVKDAYCDPVERPADVSSCHVACPGDCVVSPWSDWSDCEKPCNAAKERQRTRLLLRAPSRIDSASKDCPHLIQVQKCEANITCFTYSWKYTDYGSYLPLGGSPCGQGVQTRVVYCERSDGRAVDDHFCEPETKPESVEKWYYLGCPVDCEVSNWSPWNKSECSCGSSNGLEHRYRTVLTSPSEAGRPCPNEMVQSKPCQITPCYSWLRSPWSSCQLEGATCGHGTVYRNISCLRGEVKVDWKYCLPLKDQEASLNKIELVKLDLNTDASCYIPCYGDCEVSEWSKWSHCHRNCQDNPTGGYQTRSRAVLKRASPNGEPCPSTLWETKPCHSVHCLTFQWTIENNKVLCKRSDGLITLGGCNESQRPCLKNCTLIKNSRCVAGSCSCLEGFLPYYISKNSLHLTECAPSEDSHNQKSSEPNMTDNDDAMKSKLLYIPSDEFNIWMFAMIGIGCLFIVFVAVSIYLMCHSSNANNQESRTQMLNSAKP